MNTSDSAEEVVKITLDGMQIALKIAGTGAKNFAVMLYAILKNKEKTKGKARLSNMIKSGKPIEIFTMKAEDLKKFKDEAKKYGILYCVLANKNNSKIDGMVDIMIREIDAPKMSRIAERFNFRDIATVETEEQNSEIKQEIDEQKKNSDEKSIDNITPTDKEKEQETPSNNTTGTEKNNQLENSSDIKAEDKMEISKTKKSVINELEEIKQEQITNQVLDKEKNRNKKNYKPKHYEKKKSKKQPKHFKNEIKTR